MFITDLMQLIDEQVRSYTFDAYHALIADHANSIRMVVILYFVFLGYRCLLAKSHFSYATFLEHSLMVSFCYFAATQWSFYSLFIYELAMALPNALSVSLVAVIPNVPSEGNAIELLEYLWYSGLDIAATLWSSISISAWHQGLMALAVLIVTVLLVGYGLIVISLAKMILAIGLSLAPLFILFYLFKGSESLTIGWLRVILTVIFKQIIIYAMIALVYTLSFNTVESLLLQPQLDMIDVSSFLLLMVISLGLFFNAAQVAVTLGESLCVGVNYYGDKMRTYIKMHMVEIRESLALQSHGGYSTPRKESL